MELLDRTRRYLWAFVELAFLAVLAIVLTHLILGASAGAYVQSVVDNLTRFAAGIPTQSLVGLGVVGLLIYAVAQRVK